MLEIDSSVIDPCLLLERVRKNVLLLEEQPNFPLPGSPYATFQTGEVDLVRMEQDLHSMLENIQTLNSIWYHRDAPISTRFKLLRPIAVIVKRAIRKSIYWFTQPYVERQNAFNGAVTRAVSDSLRVQEQLLNALQKQP